MYPRKIALAPAFFRNFCSKLMLPGFCLSQENDTLHDIKEASACGHRPGGDFTASQQPQSSDLLKAVFAWGNLRRTICSSCANRRAVQACAIITMGL
jgi:hypothetical protein